MRGHRLAGTLAALAACCGAAAPARAAGTVANPAAAYAPGLIASNVNFMPADHAAAYKQLFDAGVRAVRMDFTWSNIERTKGVFDFSERDREVAAAEGAGLKVIGILDYGNPLYSTLGAAAAQTPLAGGLPPFYVGADWLFPPDDPADFARFAKQAAAHFAGRVMAWEVWNEENEGWRFWPPHEDPAAYAKLLCDAHAAIRSVDSSTPVLFGGVFYPGVPTTSNGVPGGPGMSGPDFVAAAYRANPQLGSCYDVMAYHPYPYPFTAPELDVPVRGSVLSAADGMRAAMPERKPLWITEVGWPTSDKGYGVNETKQAEYVARMAAATFAQHVPVLTYYTYGDSPDPSGGYDQEAFFGFFRTDGTPKPSLTALRTFAQTFAGARFQRDLSARLGMPPGGLMTGGRGFALRYAAPDRRITAVWLADESAAEGQGGAPDGGTAGPSSIAVRVPVRSRQVTLVSMLGETRSVTAVHGAVTVQAGPAPIYVVDPIQAG